MIRAAQACALGVDGYRMLSTNDPVEFEILDMLTTRVIKAWGELAEQQANYTANAVGKLLGG